ncbi:MAG: hypothetical protein LBC85_01955 [Fibromonadaceae bacterium]|jgi:hypothetical protein|nr:hypothetical protein [Fibromonadaceae bacterium]
MIAFNTKAFVELNRHKCSELHYLDFDGVSIVLGEKNGEFYSPFSAPFGGFFLQKKEPVLETIDAACKNLKEWLKNKKCHIIFPPSFYGESFISKCIFAMLRNGFQINYIDLNYYFDLAEPVKMQQSAKNKWNAAIRNNLHFVAANPDDIESKKIAYKIIINNRNERGYPPHLSLDELCETAKATNMRLDCFLVYADQEPIAAALVFTIEPKRAFAVLWGDNREKTLLRPMNFLAISMAEYYKSQGYLTLDMTTSTKEGVPNYGLCFFKERLGCKVTFKHTLTL